MKIFVFSDTHGDISGMELVISKSRPDVIIHCGDGMDDAIEIQKKYKGIEVHAVRGNCDDGRIAEQEKFLQIYGHTLYITHGDKFNHGDGVTKSGAKSEILEYAKRHGANIALHGHTHLATFFYENGVYVLNPGSASLRKPYDYKPSFGCIELYEDKAIFKLLSVEVFGKLSPEI